MAGISGSLKQFVFLIELGIPHITIHLTHANVQQSTGKSYSCMKFNIFYYKSRENSVL